MPVLFRQVSCRGP